MDIYVVQQGDTIYSIAGNYGINAEKLIQDNGLVYPFDLVIGQAIVIAFPKQTHTVQQGDTLQSIADAYNVTIMQILRNNPFLLEREYLYPGESLVISYNTIRRITTNGYAYPYIKHETLIKILPYLTYLSVFNYTAAEKGEIITYQDDSEIIQTAKDYGVIPLMLLTTLTQYGEPNIETAFNILINEEYLQRHIDEFIKIIKAKGYHGVNIVFNYISVANQPLYLNFLEKISNRVQQEGFLFFLTINYNFQVLDNQILLENVDYLNFSKYLNGMILVKFVWGTNYGPPAPVSNINNIRALIDNVIASGVPTDKIIIGKPILGYDWKLPYIPNKSSATSLTINSVMNIAYEVGTIIQFDEESQTPYFYYNEIYFGTPTEHIVWFVDARSINALCKLIIEYDLNGIGIWNIMIYYPQVWTVINTQFDIIKLI